MHPRDYLRIVVDNALYFCEQNFEGQYQKFMMNYVLQFCIARHNEINDDNYPMLHYGCRGS